MRKIAKSAKVADIFQSCVRANKYSKWEDFATSTHYLRYRDFLLNFEQNGISAYTEIPLDSKMKLHIDHFRKQSMYQGLKFMHTNLFVDEINPQYGACFKDNSSGIDKSAYEGPARIFDPALEDMSPFLTFDMDGNIYSAAGGDATLEERVKKTIRIFNLTHKELKSQRLGIIRTIEAMKDGGLSDDDIRLCMKGAGFPTLIDWALKFLP